MISRHLPLILEITPTSDESKKFSTKVPFRMIILWSVPEHFQSVGSWPNIKPVRCSKLSICDTLAVDIILEMKRLPNLRKRQKAIVEISLMVEQWQLQMISIAMTIVNNNDDGNNNAMASKYLTLLWRRILWS